jgi:hypothetical protein
VRSYSACGDRLYDFLNELDAKASRRFEFQKRSHYEIKRELVYCPLQFHECSQCLIGARNETVFRSHARPQPRPFDLEHRELTPQPGFDYLVDKDLPILHPILCPSFLSKSSRRHPFEIAKIIAPPNQSSTKLANASHAKKPHRQVVHDAPLSRPITTVNVNGIPSATPMANDSRFISSLLLNVRLNRIEPNNGHERSTRDHEIAIQMTFWGGTAAVHVLLWRQFVEATLRVS